MDMSRLQLFSDIAETGNLTISSERMGYTQSGVSHAISKLESEIGFPLLVRNNHGVRLTSDGEAILPRVRAILAQYDQLLNEISSIKFMERGSLCIGTYASIARHWLPRVLKEFKRLYPDIEIRIKEGGLSDLEGWLYDGSIDFGFLSWRRNSGYKFITFARDTIYAVAPMDFTLPADCKGRFPLSFFAEYPCILPDDSFDADVSGALESAGKHFTAALTCNDENTIISMVAGGLGFSLMSGLFLDVTKDVQVFPVSPDVIRTLGIGILSEKTLSVTARAFIKFAKLMIHGANMNT